MKHNPYTPSSPITATLSPVDEEAHPKQLLFPEWTVWHVIKKGIEMKKIRPITKRKDGLISTSFIFDDFVMEDGCTEFPCMAVVIVPRDIVHRFTRETKQSVEISVATLLADIFNPPRLRDSGLSLLYAYVKAHMYVIDIDTLAKHAKDSDKWSSHVHMELKATGRFKAGMTNIPTAIDPDFSDLDDHLPTCTGEVVLCRGPVGVNMLMVTMHGIPMVSVKRIMSTKIAENIRAATAQLVHIEKQQSDEEYVQEAHTFVVSTNETATAALERPVYVPPAEKHTDISPITVNEMDISILQTSGMLTDNVVHWVLLDYILEAANREPLSDCFVFNTHMASRLSDVSNRDSTNAMSLKDRMAKFFYEYLREFATYHIDGRTDSDSIRSLLFDKDYLFFPYNHEDTHWALYVFYKPYEPNLAFPIAYVFDSAFIESQQERNVIPLSVHASNVLKLRFYLKNVYDEYARFESRVIRIEPKRSLMIVKCPQQPHNTNACGLYMCEYIRCFITSAEKRRVAMDKLINTACSTRVEMTEVRKRNMDGEYINANNRTEPVCFEEELKYINRNTLRDMTRDIVEKLKAVNVSQQQEAIKRKIK